MRSSKKCWQAAKGALSSSGVDTILGVVFDDVGTNMCEPGGIRVLSVDDKVEVIEVRHNPAFIGIWAGMIVSEGV